MSAGPSSVNQIEPYESSVFSQFGEDGVLEQVFAEIGVTNRFFVEFGVGDGSQCNTRNLLENRGWHGLQMDIVEPSEGSQVRRERIDADNVNDVFAKHGVPTEFDLLSIDIDSNDYWVLKAVLAKHRPRALVVEYNSDLGPTARKTVAYDPDFSWDETAYFGASLAALHSIARLHGYELIGCESFGVNCFFVRRDCLVGFEPLTTVQAFRPPRFGKLLGHRFDGHAPTTRAFQTV